MKCKVIISHKTDLENKVNVWLSENNYEIKNIVQSFANDNYIILTIFYLTLKESRAKKLKKIKDKKD